MPTRLIFALLIGLSGNAFAANHTTEVSKKDRQDMATMHLKMADCLKSDKPMSECHKEIHADKKMMQMMMEKGGCTMMEGHHKSAGMKDSAEKNSEKK